ncbi:MAG: DUF4349 domain-containing protein [Lachnospiraceae bacterium]
MRKIRKNGKMMIAGLFMAGCLVFTGCGSTSDEMNYKAADYDYSGVESADDYGFGYSDGSGSYEVQDAMESEAITENAEAVDSMDSYDNEAGTGKDVKDTGDELSKNTAATNKKIIKTYNFSYDTETFDDAYDYLRTQITAYEGYISYSDMYGTTRRNLNLTARIPVERCDDFVNQLGSLGTLVSQSESAEDVTLQYTDTESRIDSLETEQDRLNELLKEADDLDTIITLEDRLTEVRYELENYQSQKNLYDDLITYCTVNINLSEVSYTVPVDDSSVFARIKTGLQTTFRDISYDFADFFVWFIVNLPYLIIWAIIIFVIYRIIRRCVRKSKAKRQAKKEQKLAMQQKIQNTPIPQPKSAVPANQVSTDGKVTEKKDSSAEKK